jgi:hypothetical protein
VQLAATNIAKAAATAFIPEHVNEPGYRSLRRSLAGTPIFWFTLCRSQAR